MSKKNTIVWDSRAIEALEEIAEYLEEEVSFQIAKKVVKEIIDTVFVLPDNPEIFAVDPFIKDKALEIRFFEKHSYRVLYRFHNNQIQILSVRHSSRSPLEEIIFNIY